MIPLIKLLAGRRLRRSRRPAAKPPVKHLQNIILDGVLDISKEANDAIAAEEQQRWLPFEIAFPLESPTASHFGSSGSPAEKRQEASPLQTPTSPPASPLPPSPLPLSALDPPSTATEVLRDVPASGLGRRRNFKGRQLDTSFPIPIPPMPTIPPPRPRTSSSTRSLRRQPRYTDLSTSSPICQCRTFPLSKDRKPPSTLRNSALLVGGSIASEDTTEVQDSTTPPGTPTALAFPLPPRATFTKRSTPLRVPNSATREMFTIGEIEIGVEPLTIVKRVSGVTVHESIPGSPSTVEPVMDELFSSLDDVYAEFHDVDGMSMVSISLSDSVYASARGDGTDEDDIIEDLDGEVAWRTTYSLADECAAFFTQALFPAILFRPSDETRPYPYSFLVERTQRLSTYRVQGSRSMPDLTLSSSQDAALRL